MGGCPLWASLTGSANLLVGRFVTPKLTFRRENASGSRHYVYLGARAAPLGCELVTVSRLQPYAVTIFAEMSALAARTGAVNLGQGFPDEDGPPAMLKTAENAIAEGVNQYPPGLGIAPLRQAIAAQRKRHFGTEYDPDTEVLVTVGATEAIASAVLGLVEPGSEVLLIEPLYDS